MNNVIFDFGEEREFLTPKQFDLFCRLYPLLKNRESVVREVILLLQCHV